MKNSMFPSLTSFICCALLFVILGMAWTVGLDVVRRHFARYMVPFCILFTLVRFTMVLAVVGTYVFCLSESHAESKAFAAMVLVMYGVTLVITYVIKH